MLGWVSMCLVAVLGTCVLRTGAAARPGQDKQKDNPIDKIAAQDNLQLPQMAGKWYLLGVASECNYLRENNFKLEGTTITLTAPSSPKAPLSVSTLRKLDLQCWDIRQEYQTMKTTGRFLLKGRGASNNIDIVIGETDYRSYAILYYQKRRKISVKLYGRSTEIPEDIIDKFEQSALNQKITNDFIYYFPKYGFCESADEFHILHE
ncbi:complement component C8 gamma chain [Amia ocellicauda]|uniref:complement component C8 gamma chain n=1 Tax=Amia ocellicauda TaxID=2972642 RepID=UPI003463C8CD|nr:CO8G protein [Amia calva]